MTATIMLWLLIAGAEVGTPYPKTTNVIERFATVEECERVRRLIAERSRGILTYCIQATVVRP